jgi:hypothetical protein
VDGLQLSSGSKGVNDGLWGVWLKNGADNLIRNFNAGSRLVRDIAVQGLQPGTVVSNSECVHSSRDMAAVASCNQTVWFRASLAEAS